MSAERLVVEYERRDDGAVVLRLRGRLEHLTAVDHIDSYGLDVLLETEAEARRRRATVEVIGIQESLLSHRPPLDQTE
jgi:ABC-type transporter Mla MlaB component